MDSMPGADRDYFPIRIVSQRTGVNTVTLRAWERRYGLLRPVRTAKGHRLYSDDDLLRVEQIVGWLARGVAISQVAPLLAGEVVPAAVVAVDDAAGTAWDDYRARVLQAAAAFDEQRLDDSLNEVLALYPFAIVVERLLVPLAAGQAVALTGDRARQAFLAAFLRRKLSARLLAGARHLQGAPVLVAPLDEEAANGLALHLLATSCQALDLPVLFLGRVLPPTELIVAVARGTPRALVLHGEGAHEVHALQRLLAQTVGGAAGTPVLVSGPAARIHEALVRGCRAEPLPAQLPTEVARHVLALYPEDAA